MRGRVLAIGGSDSGGGAGIQADTKSILALGAHASTAITALTAQNTLGVEGILPVAPAFIRAQMVAVLGDIGADVIKTGMLGGIAGMEAVRVTLEQYAPSTPLVIDPVMVAKGGARLMEAAAMDTLIAGLIPRATLLTPNLPEAEALTGSAIGSELDMHRAAERLLQMGCGAVLLKGGHLSGAEVIDILVSEEGTEMFRAPRIDTRHTHGTGCTLASAVAAGLAQGMSMVEAVGRARAYVRAAIAAAPGLGAGHGPLGHDVTVDVSRLPGYAP